MAENEGPVPRFMLVTDRLRYKLPLADGVRQAVAGGVDGIQVREKDLSEKELRKVCEDLLEALGGSASLIVNGSIEIARSLNIGLHLPEDGPAPQVARKVLGSTLIGRSVHSPEAARSTTDADYLIAGPVFPSKSKPGAESIGLTGLHAITSQTPSRVLGIGGITHKNAAKLIAAGAHGVAVMGPFAETDDLSSVARKISVQIERGLQVDQMNEAIPTVVSTINGRKVELQPGTTVSEFLKSKELHERLVVVERNGEILKRATFSSVVIEDGDTLEIVHFVGGGSSMPSGAHRQASRSTV